MFLTERKLDRRITEIREYSYREVTHLEEFAACEDRQGVVNPEVPTVFEGWDTIHTGDRWSGRDRYLWLHREITIPEEELDAAEGKPYIYDCKVKLDPEKSKDYSVPYYVQGGLFNTYVLENEPIDKWATFKEFNDEAQAAPSFGFDFDLTNVSTEVAGFRNVLDEFGKSLYTGSVDPEEYLPQLEKKMEATGIDKVVEEMQKQIDEWKAE